MISYKSKDWAHVITHFHKADTVRILFWPMVIMAIYSAGVAYVENTFIDFNGESHVKNLTIIQSLLGFVLSLLLVFRTNTAYDRWWEGRKLWGALVNNSRNFALKMNAILPSDDHASRRFFKEAIPHYASALRDHLKSEEVRLELDENSHPDFNHIDRSKHIPNQIASLLYQRTFRMNKEGKISMDQFLSIQPELQSFTDICGACERIKNTPIPYSYSVFVKKFIFFYTISLPIGFVFSLGYYVIPVSVLVFYALTSLEIIAEEIEDPFGGDTNDLPTGLIAANIRKHVGEIIH
ncbi:MAG: bestrophin family protein [Flavobacteriales bacterium]|jgi:ion channel-forming bestrophin family protein